MREEFDYPKAKPILWVTYHAVSPYGGSGH